MKTFMCPHCQAMIPADSVVCPECGSDQETGWSEGYNADLLPAREEEPGDRPPRRLWRKAARIAGVLLAAAILAGFITVELPPYGIYAGCAIIAAAVIVLLLSRDRTASALGREGRLERELVKLCGSDEDLADRLVKFEGYRKPGAPRAVLIKNAIDRLLRDRGR